MKPYDTKTVKIDCTSFDKQKLFDYINDLLIHNNIGVDDFKGHISCDQDEELNATWIYCRFKWIFYNNDVPKSKFVEVANQIISIIADAFNIQDTEIDISRFNDSYYTDVGYDVEMEFTLEYDMK